MRRAKRLILGCMLGLFSGSLAAAQQVPTSVVRLGDWVEVGNEVFMNIIAQSDIRYQTTQNYDFESRIQDRVASRDPLNTIPHDGEGDLVFVENRLGVDMRYQKNLQFQLLLEHQSVLDGNLIDNARGNSPGPATQTFADGGTLGAAQEANTFNVERYWMDYTFPAPVSWLRIRVGADLWLTDQAGVLGDDDPRFAVFATFGPKKEWEFEAAAVIQSESARLGLTNDNDFIYYTFGAAYKLQSYKFAVHGAYFRDRFTGAQGAPGGAKSGNPGQEIDSGLLMPSITGTAGPISFLLQGLLVYGKAEGDNVTGSRDLNIFSWGAVAHVEANLGVVRPFIGVIYGSGDDDPTDKTLSGFAPLPQREITLMTATRYFEPFLLSTSFGARDVAPPARSRNAELGGTEFRHTVGNPFSDRIGNRLHSGINTAYSNPGTLMPLAGIKLVPLKGHQVDLYYIYTRVLDATLLEVALGAPNIDESMYHEFALQYSWTPSPHFDVRLAGGVIIPGEGSQDVASTVDCNFSPGVFAACQGDDVALRGQARFRARF